MFTTLLHIAVAVVYLAAAMRLLCFNRTGLRHRRGISLMAGLLIASLICAGLEILLYQPPVSLWQSAIAILLCILVNRSRGNLAAMLRPTL